MEGESEHVAYAENGFNIKVSDRVSLDRSLKVNDRGQSVLLLVD